MKTLRQFSHTFALVVTASAILSACAVPVSATTIPSSPSPGSFSFKIDQNLIALDNFANISNLEAAIADGAQGLGPSLLVAESVDTTLISMWYSYSTILSLREIPGLMLANDASSTLNIIGMELLLDDDDNQFMQFQNGEYFSESYAPGEYTYIDLNTYDYSRVDPDQVPSSVNVFDDAQRFVMNFGNGGIKPGRATTFRVKTNLGKYLHEFFDESTLLDVIYQDPISKDIFSTGPQPLSAINEFNEDLLQQVADGTKNGLHFQGMVDPYWIGGNLEPIPEPAGILLAITGFSCMALRRRRVA